MDLLNSLLIGVETVMAIKPLLIVSAGVFLGILAGAMPGLSPSTAVALLVPFSYTMEPTHALILLTSIYIASNYGGSITAVLINTPGTPASAVTAIDGYALTKKGKAGTGLGIALAASTIGGAIGVVILVLFAVPLAKWAIKFSPADYFALALFGLATVASMGKGNILKALIATVFGLLLKAIGIDPISGVSRYTVGVDELYDGFHLIPALIGLFAISVVIEKALIFEKEEGVFEKVTSKLPGLRDLLDIKGTIFKSSMIGTIIGIFPGAGATIASFISYDVAKKSSKKPEDFGEGALDGVAASESANSSSVGGALVPLLALGIPGSATDAVLLGAFMLHDLNPGPLLFQDAPELVYGIFVSLFIANIMLFIMGLLGNRFFIKVVSIPEKILYPMILMVAVIGSYAVNNNLFDVASCLAFGFIGWFFKRHQFPVAPIVLGIVLGKMIEENLRRAVLMNGLNSFWDSKLALVMLVLAGLSFLYPLLKRQRA